MDTDAVIASAAPLFPESIDQDKTRGPKSYVRYARRSNKNDNENYSVIANSDKTEQPRQGIWMRLCSQQDSEAYQKENEKDDNNSDLAPQNQPQKTIKRGFGYPPSNSN